MISKKFLGWVVAPTLVSATYFFLVATPVYRSTTSLMVTNPSKESGGVSAFLTGGTGDSMTGAFLTQEFAHSWDEFNSLNKTFDLHKFWAEGDIISSYYKITNSKIGLFNYYKRHVNADIDKKSGIVRLEVYAYSADAAQKMGRQILDDTALRINAINAQKDEDLTRTAETELVKAREAVLNDNSAIAAFRKKTGFYKPDLDYAAALQAQSQVADALASAKADYTSVITETPNNPGLGGIHSKISSYTADQSSLEAKASKINEVAKQYDALEANRRLDLAMLEKAGTMVQGALVRSNADHYYLNVISEPSAPGDAEFPRAALNTLMVLFALLVFYKFVVS